MIYSTNYKMYIIYNDIQLILYNLYSTNYKYVYYIQWYTTNFV